MLNAIEKVEKPNRGQWDNLEISDSRKPLLGQICDLEGQREEAALLDIRDQFDLQKLVEVGLWESLTKKRCSCCHSVLRMGAGGASSVSIPPTPVSL